jgi:hypothetical protein
MKGILSGSNYHQNIVPFAAKLRVGGLTKAATINITRALLLNSNGVRDKRWHNRFATVPKVVDTAWNKFKPPITDILDPWAEPPVPQFPFDILPPMVEEYAASQSVILGADTSSVAMAVLGAFSGAIDHRFALKMMRHGSWYENPRLWLLFYGPPSVGKTPMFNAVCTVITEHQTTLYRVYQEQQEDYEVRKEAGEKIKKPKPPARFLVTDITADKLAEVLARSPHGILVKRDELAGWIGAMERYHAGKGAAADRAVWLQAFDGGPYNVDRIVRGEIFVPNLSAAVMGGIQPARLAELDGLTTDGLLQRFLPVVMGAATLAQDTVTNCLGYDNFVKQLLHATPSTLQMNDAALECMGELRENIHEIVTVTEGLISGFPTFVGKLPGYAGRLALILHMAEHPEYGHTRRVEAKTVENVGKLIVDFVIPHALRFYGAAEEKLQGNHIKTLASWILTSGKTRIVVSDVTNNVWDARSGSV